MNTFRSGCSKPGFMLESVVLRVCFLFVLAMVSGIYWNLGWPLALPFIGLAFPVGIPVFIAWLCPGMSGGRRYGIYVVMVFLSEAIRGLLYVGFGHGLQYLLHDGETQLIYMVIMVEQLLLGGMTIWVLAWLNRRKHLKA